MFDVLSNGSKKHTTTRVLSYQFIAVFIPNLSIIGEHKNT